MDTFFSGVDYYTIGLVNGLLSIDEENQYVLFTNQPNAAGIGIKKAKNLNIKKLPHLKTRLKRIKWEHLNLPAIAEKEKLDILHCPAYICPFFTSKLPYVVTIHDTIALDYPQFCKISNVLYYNIFLKHTVKKSAKIITVSKDSAQQITQNFNVCKNKLKVIHPGIDQIFNQSALANHEKEAEIRVKYNLPAKYILFVGNLEPKKNLINLLHTFKLLSKTNLPHKLLIVGQRTWKSKKILAQLKKYSNSNNIILLGYLLRNELSCIYKMADLYLSLSFAEGFCFPALEAMASKTPVVATNVGILKEIDKGAFYPVKPQNPLKTAQAIYSLITNKDLRQKQIDIAAKETNRFKWSLAAQKVLSIYREVTQAYE